MHPSLFSNLLRHVLSDRLAPFVAGCFLVLAGAVWPGLSQAQGVRSDETLEWTVVTELPDPLGVAGPIAGIHNDALIVAGGANFPLPVWESDKVWHDAIHVLTREGQRYEWHDGGRLPARRAYAAVVSTSLGVVSVGGGDGASISKDVWLLQWDSAGEQVETTSWPALPRPCAYGSAAVIGNTIYLVGGQSGPELETAMANFWSLDLSRVGSPEFVWRQHDRFPGPERSFNVVAAQHNGFEDCLYVMSGRRSDASSAGGVEFLRDVWEYTPSTGQWRERAPLPRCVMAGSAIAAGQSHILVLGGDSGNHFFESNALRDHHPGFPRSSLAYHTIIDSWSESGSLPANHVTTSALWWNDTIVIPSGEIRPRTRSPVIWQARIRRHVTEFGWVNYGVLTGYLVLMVLIGAWFSRTNHTTDDYFRGGKHIPWWAAGCSIFATMLSSLTFTGIPSKAFAQDWTYALGNFMIPVVAVVAIYVALPFFRRIDATSAYEYLELRFNRNVRWFGSTCFTCFHLFRMAVVLSLTALALSVATPLTPSQSVLLMGVLSVIYCTLGGIEAVIWTDTLQTGVLLGGATIALLVLITGTEGGALGFWETACREKKLTMAHWHWDITSTQIAVWVIIIGGIGQNLSSYTADQAVVQRYMTTADQRLAARSIALNAVMTIPATLLFFGIGTALFTWYRGHPANLTPSVTTDQIFPLFISSELPAGVAGLIVAGIFAAAQSTISTSMNSISTTVVTDFLRPTRVFTSEKSYLWAARSITLAAGILGTLLGLYFVDPAIRSLFDAFIKVIGLFMGVLGGLFVLGVTSDRANAFGAMCGAIVGSGVMLWLWVGTTVNGYIYTTAGILSCVVVGYVASRLRGGEPDDIQGLTLRSLSKSRTLDVSQPAEDVLGTDK